MGMMPPYDPVTDPSLVWARVRVVCVDPPAPCWSRPARVVLAVEETLRGELPATVEVSFGPPREAGQAYFYADRNLGPPPHSAEALVRHAAERAALDQQAVEVPDVGAEVVVWLARTPDGHFDIPTLRLVGAPGLAPPGPGGPATRPPPMPGPDELRSRWVTLSALPWLRARLGL